MRTRYACLGIALAVSAACGIFAACSKDSDDDSDGEKGTLTTEEKADATKAATASTSQILARVNSGSSLKDAHVRAQLRAAVAEAKARRKLISKLQEDDAGGSTPGIDICAFFGTACEGQLNKDLPVDEYGQKCSTTSCTGGWQQTCSSESETATCAGVTYTLTDSSVKTNIGCTKGAAENEYTISVTGEFSGAMSGGSIKTPVTLACTFQIAMPMTLGGGASEGGDEDVNLSCEKGEFTCSLDGKELSCAELKAAMESNACG